MVQHPRLLYGLTAFDKIAKLMFRGTEREQLVKQRIGQDALMKYRKGCCAITAIDIPELLSVGHRLCVIPTATG